MRIELLPLSLHEPGTHQSGEIDIPDDASEYLLRVARCTDDAQGIWPDPQHLLRVEVEIHAIGEWMEEGSPQRLEGWHPWGAFDAYGGKHISRDGSVPRFSWLRGGLHVPLPGRKLRARLITSSEVRTSMDIEVV